METKFHIQEEESYLYTINNYLDKAYADKLFKECQGLDLITEPKVRTGTCHRRVGFYSDKVSGYYFSGQKTPSKPSVPLLRKLLGVIHLSFAESYKSIGIIPSNAILINEYRDGTDHIGSHSDSEKDLDSRLIIALSLFEAPTEGSHRTFRIRRKNGEPISGKNYLDITTSHGQLLVMGGDFQKYFKHEIPVEKSKMGSHRISLTFRTHKEDK